MAQIQSDHRNRNNEYDRYDRLYYKEHWQSPMEEGDYQVTMPIHTETVNTAHSILTGFRPTITVYPNRDSERDKEIADNIERWHMAVDQENKSRMGRDEWAQAVFDQTRIGAGVIREVYSFPPGWIKEELDQDEMDTFPVVQQAINPVQVYWQVGNPVRGRFRLIFYQMEMTVADIESTYDIPLHTRRNEKGQFTEKDYDEVRLVTDWWEWKGKSIYHCIFTNVRDPNDSEPLGQFIKPYTEMPEYYTLPYHIFFFRDTGSMEPERMGLSILYTLTDTPHDMEILSSRMMRIAEMYANPILVITRNPQIGGDEEVEVHVDPGSVLELFAGEDARYLQWQGSPPDFRYLWEKFDELTKEHSFARGLLGQGSDSTGFRAALDRETSLLKVSKALENYEQARANLYIARSYALSKLSMDRKISARGLDPTEGRYTVSVDGKTLWRYRDITVEVKPRFPGDLARDVNTVTQAVAAHLMDLDKGMEIIGENNKKKTRDAIKKDMIEFHPMVIEAEVQEYLAERQQQKQEEEMETAAGSGFGTPPPMMPGMEGEGNMATPGPSPSAPGLPGMPSAPGQPAGANPLSGMTAALDNRLRNGTNSAGNLPPGTVLPVSAG